MEFKDYQKYRWFYTSSEKLVIGGKNAEQNEMLLKTLKAEKKDKIIMHTATPGSPFSAILADVKSVKKEDINECSIFTACFSRAWRDRKIKAEVDIFKLSKLYKLNTMKVGTWGVKGKIKRISVPLALVLIKQKSKLRAVPESAAKSKKDILLRVLPGNMDKKEILNELKEDIKSKYTEEEILSAFPSGAISIKK
ncbi:MAG: NFACT RNA binding domain-containing protein [Nanoarchaeota archaeon]